MPYRDLPASGRWEGGLTPGTDMNIRPKFFLIFFLCLLFFYFCQKIVHDQTEKGQRFVSTIEKAGYDSQLSEVFYRKAVEQYRQALTATPDSEEIYYALGALYYRHADYESALEALGRVQNPEALKLTAMCYYKTGRFTDALTIFHKLGEIEDDTYLYYYALTCEQQNLYEQALKIYPKIKSPEYQAEVKTRMEKITALAHNIDLNSLDPKIRERILNAPSPEQYPQAGAVVLYSQEDIVIQQDNTMEFVQHHLIKILNDRGKRHAEIEIGYDSTYDKVEIDFARTIKPNGQVISIGAKHIRDVSRYLNYPLYSNARVMIISMPEVSNGAFVEYQVRLRRGKLVAEKQFDTLYTLQSLDPIAYAQFTVTMPKGRTLHQRILNEQYNTAQAHLKPKVTSQEDRDVYTWEFHDIPQIIPEPAMPPFREITPVILLSTFSSWDEIYQWWWPLVQDKIEADDQMREKIKKLTEGKVSLKEKARAIYNFTARELRYVAIEYGQAGYEPHRASEIFRNKYGDCKDKSVLLISMLKEIGIPAYPVLIATQGVVIIPDDFPMIAFNHCIVLARIKDEMIFLDPTGEAVLFGDLPGGDQGRKVLAFFEDKGKIDTTAKFAAEHNRALSRTVLHFDDEENIQAERTVLSFGSYDQSQRYRLRYTMPVLIEENIKERIQEILPGGRLLNYRIENLESTEEQIQLRYRFQGSDFLLKAGGHRRVIPPLGGVDLDLVSKDSRQYPIDFSIPRITEDILEIKLPKHYRVQSLPDPIMEKTPWFIYETSYAIVEDTLTFLERTVTMADRLEVQDYPRYKSILERLSQDVRYCVILERENNAAPRRSQ